MKAKTFSRLRKPHVWIPCLLLALLVASAALISSAANAPEEIQPIENSQTEEVIPSVSEPEPSQDSEPSQDEICEELTYSELVEKAEASGQRIWTYEKAVELYGEHISGAMENMDVPPYYGGLARGGLMNFICLFGYADISEDDLFFTYLDTHVGRWWTDDDPATVPERLAYAASLQIEVWQQTVSDAEDAEPRYFAFLTRKQMKQLGEFGGFCFRFAQPKTQDLPLFTRYCA